MDNNNRFGQLQIFRFIAFLVVFAYHVPMFRFKILPPESSGISVMIFFVYLSGFVSAYSLYRVGDIKPVKENIYKYIRRKVVKLYPLYFLTNIMAIAYEGLPQHIGAHDFKETGLDLLALVKDLTLIRSIIPWRQFSYNGLSWYVSAIIILSILCIPIHHFVCSFIDGERADMNLVWLFCGGITYTLLSNGALLVLGRFNQFYLNPLFRAGDFISGMMLGYIVIRYKEKHKEANIKRNTILEIVLFILWISAFYVSNYVVSIILGFAVNFAVIFVFAIGRGKLSRVLSVGPLVRLGDISFECYIIHQVIINLYCRCNGYENYTRTGRLFGLFFCLFVSICLADLLHGKKQVGSPKS